MKEPEKVTENEKEESRPNPDTKTQIKHLEQQLEAVLATRRLRNPAEWERESLETKGWWKSP